MKPTELEYEADLQKRHKQGAFVTLVGAFFNVLLAAIKCLAGWFGNSHALFADGIHSLSDLFADGIVFLASKFGNEKADEEHPYGHHRMETAATIAIALFLLTAAVGIIGTGGDHVLHPNHDTRIQPYVLGIAFLALVINEAIYWLTLRVAKKIHSDMLIAHAWHRRSDAIASLIVLLGIAGSMLGFYYLDGIAAILVGLFILRMAWGMGRKAFDELVDRGVSEAELTAITQAILKEEGVIGIHQLRTRLSGGKIIADVHLMVDPLVSVSEGHYIGEQVYALLRKQFPDLSDVTVHVDSENDEFVHTNLSLPGRKKILAMLDSMKSELPYFEEAHVKMIHYMGLNILVELIFPVDILNKISKNNLQTQYSTLIKARFPTLNVQLYFE